jgi:hypothetical protein
MREPLQLPPDEAPWGHDGIPRVTEVVKAEPLIAGFVALFPLFGLWLTFQGTHGSNWSLLFVPAMPILWWVLMWLAIHGYIDFDD